jgi:hypothetical protein
LIRQGSGWVGIVIRLDVQPSLRFLGHQIGADKGVQVTIHDAVHVSYLEFRAMVFDQAVRLHDIRPDLTAKGNVQLALVKLIGVRLALLDFQIVEARTEHLHRHFTILVLAALRLTANDDVGREVGDAYSGFHFVYVLPAFATRTKRVNAQVFGPDVDLDAVVNFRNNENGGKGSVAPRRLVERRDSNETVNSGFSSEKTIGIFARELDRGRFDAGFFSRGLVEERGGHSSSLRPSQVHAKKDGSPILRFRPARAGLDGHDGIEVIGLSGEQRPGFQFGDVGIGGVELPVQLLQQIVLLFDVGLFLGEMDVGLGVAGDGDELFVRGNLFFGTLALTENALGGFLIAPKIGVGYACFESLQALAVQRCVKDSSARA